MDNIEIRRVTMNDIQLLQDISRETFVHTFSETNNAEDMSKYLVESFSIEKLSMELRIATSEFYFAILDDKVIGYLKLNTGNSQTEALDKNALEIERIYVLSEYHGKKVGQVLFNKALDTAAALKSTYVWLGVWEHNPRAIRFYQRNGFVEFDKHLFKLGDEEQTDIMMKKML